MNLLFTVKVKWGKNVYPDIELNTDEDPLLFKAQIFALTGVQPDRQKVMLKGAQIKEGWTGVPVKQVRNVTANNCCVICFMYFVNIF